MSTTKLSSRTWACHSSMIQYANFAPHPPQTVYAGNRTYTKVNSVTADGPVPDWRKKILLGLDATSSLTGWRYYEKRASMTIDIWHAGYLLYHYSGDLMVFYDSAYVYTQLNVVNAIADGRARSKFLSHYISATNTWRGGNFLAEIRETIHMLRHPVQSFYHETYSFAGRVGKLRKVRYRNPLDKAKAVADAWLAYSFGVKPLIADANDAMSALNRLKQQGGTGRDRKVISALGHFTEVGKADQTGLACVSGDPVNPLDITWFYKVDWTVRYKASLKSRLEDLTTVGEQFGVGVFDIVPAVWEAIPWSFFIDYFANVGEMIDSCRLWAADFGWCFRSVRNAGTSNVINARLNTNATSWGPSYLSGKGTYSLCVYVNRAPSSIPYPSFRFQMPGLDSMKWLNIAALTEQVRKAGG